MTAVSAATGPMAWRRDSFQQVADYAVGLNDADRQEVVASVHAVSTRLRTPEALRRDDFDFPRFDRRLQAAYDEVRCGRGFALLRGLPVDALTREEFIAAVWGIGTRFGRAISQNAQGELIGHVIDASKEEATPRMFRSNLELRPHTDWTAMLSLACWQSAASGGATYVASALTIHEEIKRRAPEFLAPLYNGFHYHRLGEEGEGEEPVSPYRIPVFGFKDGQLSCRYQRAGIAAGHRAADIPLTDLEVRALDLFDEVAKAPQHRLAFYLERGDMLIVNNYTMLHARTGFTEHPEPERRRHLVRLWLDANGFRDVVPETHLFAVNGVPPQPGRSCTYDFRKLYGDDPRATGGLPKEELADADVVPGGRR